ncbi:hypothetical protein J2X37_001877 [Croceicoccus sp. BE223]|nr:hypothetical protein [Croceicoccus sp. BE223]
MPARQAALAIFPATSPALPSRALSHKRRIPVMPARQAALAIFPATSARHFRNVGAGPVRHATLAGVDEPRFRPYFALATADLA